MTDLTTGIARAREILSRVKHPVVITGAGMSAECGLPTFRDAKTNNWDTLARQLATAEGFRADPQRVWEWYAGRWQEARRAVPHPGYTALAAWEQRANVRIITQNVDGLHRRSGSSQVVELHGSLNTFFCFEQQHPVEFEGLPDLVPQCPYCESLVRPGVVWFGEMIPEEAQQGAAEAMLQFDALLVVGTSLYVSTPQPYIRFAERRGVPIIEVNPDLALEQPTVGLSGPAGVVLPQILC